MKKLKYTVICAQAVGGNGHPITIGYTCDRRFFDTRAEAIAHGFTKVRSDDFNIGVLHGGDLISLDWMDERVTIDPDKLLQIHSDLSL